VCLFFCIKNITWWRCETCVLCFQKWWNCALVWSLSVPYPYKLPFTIYFQPSNDNIPCSHQCHLSLWLSFHTPSFADGRSLAKFVDDAKNDQQKSYVFETHLKGFKRDETAAINVIGLFHVDWRIILTKSSVFTTCILKTSSVRTKKSYSIPLSYPSYLKHHQQNFFPP
jgi:hypothetical protein